jgi:hypothetical protein
MVLKTAASTPCDERERKILCKIVEMGNALVGVGGEVLFAWGIFLQLEHQQSVKSLRWTP